MTQAAIHVGGARSGRAKHLERMLAGDWGRALLIVPTRGAARQRLERVLREHALPGCVDAAVIDFKSFAESILHREGERARMADDLRRRRILEAAIGEMHAAGAIAGLPDPGVGPGLVAHLLEVITQIKQSALEPHEFRERIEGAGELSPLDAMTAAAYAAYQDALIANGLYDVPGLYWRAHVIAQERAPRALDGIGALIFDGFDDFTPSEFRLVTALAPHVERMAFGLAYDLQSGREDLHARAARTLKKIQGTFNAVLREHESAACVTLSDHAADSIFWRDRPGPCEKLVDNLRIVPCIDPQHEAETIARRVRSLIGAGAVPGRIAVVYRNIAGAAAWIQAAMAEFDVPAQVHHAPPLAASAVGAFVLSVLGIAARWERESVAEVIASPLFAPFGKVDPLLLSASSIARRAIVLEGRAEWAQRIEACAKRTEDQDEAAIAGAVGAAVARLGELLDAVPARGTCAAYCEAVDALIEGLGIARALAAGEDARAARELEQLAALRGLLGALAEGGDAAMTREEYVALLEQALRETAGPTARARGGVQCLDAANARHLDFDHVFFAGLNEGSVPQPSATNAIYNDAERARLNAAGIELEGRRERAEREMALYHHVLALPRTGMVLSYCLTQGGREASPSPFLVQTKELFAKARPEVIEAAPLADAFLPELDDAASLRELRNGAFHLRAATLEEPFADAAAGARIERARIGGGEFDGHDGVVLGEAAQAALAARYGAAHVFSVAQLESYAECPFQFFVRRALKIEEEDAPEAELGAMLRGSILHRVLQLFHEHFAGRAASEIPEAEAGPLLEGLIARVFDEQAWKAQAAPAGVIAAERRRMELLLGRYFAWAREEHGTEWKPARFEVAFGPVKGETAATCAPAFELASPSGEAKFSGRIDRIDECNGALRLMDYKTGGVPGAGEIRDGISLQLGVYAWVCEQMLLPGQSCTEAYFVRVGKAKDQRALGGKKFDRAAYDAMLHGQIDRCLTGIRTGVFPPLPQVKACYGCTTAHICRHEKARIERKVRPELFASVEPGGEDGGEDL